MITDEQIKNIIFDGLHSYDIESTELKIIRDNGYVTISAQRMYEYCPLKTKTIIALSQLFKTADFEEPDREHSHGCDTCDYGSIYKWTLRVKEPED